MIRYFTYYWKNSTFSEIKQFQGLIDLWESSEMFSKRGIKENDYVYSVTVIKGILYVIAALQVDKILTREEATDYLGADLAEKWPASHHIIAKNATPIMLETDIPVDIVKKMRFLSKRNKPKFSDESSCLLDSQTFRAIRELTEKSAELLEKQIGSFEQVTSDHLKIWKDIVQRIEKR